MCPVSITGAVVQTLRTLELHDSWKFRLDKPANEQTVRVVAVVIEIKFIQHCDNIVISTAE